MGDLELGRARGAGRRAQGAGRARGLGVARPPPLPAPHHSRRQGGGRRRVGEQAQKQERVGRVLGRHGRGCRGQGGGLVAGSRGRGRGDLNGLAYEEARPRLGLCRVPGRLGAPRRLPRQPPTAWQPRAPAPHLPAPRDAAAPPRTLPAPAPRLALRPQLTTLGGALLRHDYSGYLSLAGPSWLRGPDAPRPGGCGLACGPWGGEPCGR
jgi:hypothetical protein